MRQGGGGGPAGGEGGHAGDEASVAWLGPGGVTLIAPILATVDLERALRDLGVPAPRCPPSPDSLLGARIAVVDAPRAGRLAVAEPSTEGRLAAALARHGEGPVGRYVRTPVGLDEVRLRAAAAAIPLSRPAVGPFGRSVLVLGGPVTGPYLILVDPAAVPSRP